MKNRWDQTQADEQAAASALGLRVYTSNLLGADADLVLHGGGNTSVKGTVQDVFGDELPVLFVKGSGWDLRTIAAAGFPAVRLEHLLRLADLETLSDSEMMRQLRLGLLDPTAPTPSVEAILHALIPYRYVDHTHADAVVTLSNTPGGEQRLKDLYGEQVLVLPYIMPGFILARQVAVAGKALDWKRLRGIVLMHHGIFTFADAGKQSYDTMIELVDQAESCLRELAGAQRPASKPAGVDADRYRQLAALRRAAGELFGGVVLARLDHSAAAAGFAGLNNCGELIQRGPLTPDHTIHAKAFGAVFDADDPEAGLQRFQQDYQAYFEAHADSGQHRLDSMPRYGVWRGQGLVYLAPNHKRLEIVSDITRHTVQAIQQAEAAGGWTTLPRAQLFAVEYWELEQAKLKAGGSRGEFEGKVALVTGAASGIGRACVEDLVSRGAVVGALDIADSITGAFDHPAVVPLQCDVTDSHAVGAALEALVGEYGGLDMLVSNAGAFPASAAIADTDEQTWQQSLDINLTSHQRLLRACIPYLKLGFEPAVVMVASKNVPAPGPGAGAYSAAKAGLTQLARVAALELGEYGIRVNTIHPNAVYDTAIWTQAVLSQRAAHYGLSVAEYRRANVLKTQVHSRDVAATVCVLLGAAFAKTTGAQIPVDGGNERVI